MTRVIKTQIHWRVKNDARGALTPIVVGTRMTVRVPVPRGPVARDVKPMCLTPRDASQDVRMPVTPKRAKAVSTINAKVSVPRMKNVKMGFVWKSVLLFEAARVKTHKLALMTRAVPFVDQIRIRVVEKHRPLVMFAKNQTEPVRDVLPPPDVIRVWLIPPLTRVCVRTNPPRVAPVKSRAWMRMGARSARQIRTHVVG